MSEVLIINETTSGRAAAKSPSAMLVDELGGEIPSNDAISVEDALAEAKQVIQHRDQQIEAEREARTRAERAAHRATTARQQDIGTVMAAQMEAATTAQEQAKAAIRTARESGDLDAELKAQEALAYATQRVGSLQLQDQQMKMAPPVEQQQQAQLSPAVQQWIDTHPRFNSDAAYRREMLVAHADLIADGIKEESPAYFRALNQRAAELEQPATRNGNGRQQRDIDMTTRDSGFQGAPPSSAGGGNGAGRGAVQTALGTVHVSRTAGGVTQIHIPPQVKDDFVEGARICGMALGDYALEQVRIAQEQRAGGNASLILQEGKIYR